jgi:hypothetical protein
MRSIALDKQMLICTALDPTFIHQLFVIWTLRVLDFPIIFAAWYDVVQPTSIFRAAAVGTHRKPK